LQVEVVDGPNDVRTGHLGTFRRENFVFEPGEMGRPASTAAAGTVDWRWNRDNEGTAYFEGVMTSTLVIEESIARAASRRASARQSTSSSLTAKARPTQASAYLVWKPVPAQTGTAAGLAAQ